MLKKYWFAFFMIRAKNSETFSLRFFNDPNDSNFCINNILIADYVFNVDNVVSISNQVSAGTLLH